MPFLRWNWDQIFISIDHFNVKLKTIAWLRNHTATADCTWAQNGERAGKEAIAINVMHTMTNYMRMEISIEIKLDDLTNGFWRDIRISRRSCSCSHSHAPNELNVMNSFHLIHGTGGTWVDIRSILWTENLFSKNIQNSHKENSKIC